MFGGQRKEADEGLLACQRGSTSVMADVDMQASGLFFPPSRAAPQFNTYHFLLLLIPQVPWAKCTQKRKHECSLFSQARHGTRTTRSVLGVRGHSTQGPRWGRDDDAHSVRREPLTTWRHEREVQSRELTETVQWEWIEWKLSRQWEQHIQRSTFRKWQVFSETETKNIRVVSRAQAGKKGWSQGFPGMLQVRVL